MQDPEGRATKLGIQESYVQSDLAQSTDSTEGTERITRKKYGNMFVLYDGRWLITMGPDYLCFLPTFFVFLIVSYFITRFVFYSTDNLGWRLLTLFICFGQPLSYLVLALSNPKMVIDSAELDQMDENLKKPCRECKFWTPKTSRHCLACGVCIYKLDHHCPWSSKCIAANNMTQFQIFLVWTPLYLMYIMAAFAICTTTTLQNIQHSQ